jgi:hypothetical protein
MPRKAGSSTRKRRRTEPVFGYLTRWMAFWAYYYGLEAWRYLHGDPWKGV